MSTTPDTPDADRAAGLARRLAAVIYDALLLFAVLLLGTALVMIVSGGPVPAGTWYHQLALLVITFGYFAFCWTRTGQTLGMKTWRLRVRTFDGRRLGWGRSTLRFAAAVPSWLALGLGELWVLVDPQRMSWHDRLSRTVLVVVPREGTRG